MITALAAQIAGTDNPAEIARNINGVTCDGEKCTSWDDCLALIEAGDDIDYDGASGPQEFSQNGEPTEASFGILVYARTATRRTWPRPSTSRPRSGYGFKVEGRSRRGPALGRSVLGDLSRSWRGCPGSSTTLGR